MTNARDVSELRDVNSDRCQWKAPVGYARQARMPCGKEPNLPALDTAMSSFAKHRDHEDHVDCLDVEEEVDILALLCWVLVLVYVPSDHIEGRPTVTVLTTVVDHPVP